ncbi:MAG: alpha/beta hydrolase [Planctomycetales bacterium]|nr:alpha/beta hydrolase [Planctomycetales bacterium]
MASGADRLAGVLVASLAGVSLGPSGCAGAGAPSREEVAVRVGDVTLAGVLEVPPGPGPHPAIVIVPGSGPASREFPLYADLARHWLERGFAVLRYDKRGAGGSTGDWSRETFQERADDVRALAALLRARPDIRADRVGLCGHSQGGWIAPLAASAGPREIAFLVILAGSAETPAEQDLSSTRHRLRAAGFDETAAGEAVALKRALHDLARGGTVEPTGVARLLDAASDRPWFRSVIPPGLDVGEVCRLLRHLALIMDHAAEPVLEQVSCPVLALFGEKDPFVDPAENAGRMERALRRGTRDVSVQVVPGAGHRLEPAGTSGRGFAAGVLEALDSWLEARVGH